MTEPARNTLLGVQGLSVAFDVAGGEVQATDGVAFDIASAETVAVVGESGSGKSVTAYAIVGLLAKNGRVVRGDITFSGRHLSPAAARSLRGRDIAFIFQNPHAALNPIRAVGDQIVDCLIAAGKTVGPRALLRSQAVELLDKVRIAHSKSRYRAYPHELSGGMCQRVLIAMALAAQPKLLIADEPTTGLDVTTQRVVMDLLSELAAASGMATLLITHDLGLAAEYCARIVVMQKGRVVEQGAADRIVEAPQHVYTQRLVSATPRPERALIDLLPEAERGVFSKESEIARMVSPAVSDVPLLEVEGLSHSFDLPARFGWLMGKFKSASERQALRHQAVRDVSFKLQKGEALGIVGESGSGKTTTSRMVAGLLTPEKGHIRFGAIEITSLSPSAFARSELRRRIQFVFQDPQGSLNPRFTAYQAIANPLCNFSRHEGQQAEANERTRVRWAAEKAGLDPSLLGRHPHQLSGGQQARVGIARALVVEPDLLILDEPTSALDVSVQALVLNQLDLLRRELGLSFIFVSHDLHVVRLLCDRVLVMRQGEVVEAGPVADVFSKPSHPYTRELLDAIPGGHRRKAQPQVPQARSMEDEACLSQPT